MRGRKALGHYTLPTSSPHQPEGLQLHGQTPGPAANVPPVHLLLPPLSPNQGKGWRGRAPGGGWRAERSGAARIAGSPLLFGDFFCLFLGFGVTQSRAGRQKAGVREAGRLLSVLPFISLFLLIYFFFPKGCWRRLIPFIVWGEQCG